MPTAPKDWSAWHRHYDDPDSGLSRRLATVRVELARLLDARPGRPTQLVSMCCGDARDTIPVLAEGYRDVRAVLVELDPDLAARAATQAADAGLTVDVRVADAGQVDTYAGVPRADVFMACGVFGNVTDADLDSTVGSLSQLLAPGAAVIWTRGPSPCDPTSFDGHPAELVRQVFAEHGYAEERFCSESDHDFRVGVHRLVGPPTEPVPGRTMFTFTR